MGKNRRINLKKVVERRTFAKLLSSWMDEMEISQDELAEKISNNEQIPHEIDPRNIRYYISGKRIPKKEGRIGALAAALGIQHYELHPDYESVNCEEDEPDNVYYWKECMKEIEGKLRGLSAEQAKLLFTSYNELLSIPAEAIDISAMYHHLDEESQAQFLAYLDILQGEPTSMSFTKYDLVFARLERITNVPNGGIMDSSDLSQLLIATFPIKENTEEEETFSRYLLLLNKDLREIAKGYLSLDSDIKRGMILRIADQMLVVQKAATT
ncbi:helix-turn-helix domain-containing protein [Bacillus sp. CGMCC 1.16607]|uniref:helix-turn-helix domain-containing protein n=1 Tax=Bacillus sp. CGMCC 1.16607 TaxID=3351842 RepID=UPI0036365DAD